MALSGNFTGATLAYSTANLSGYTGDTVLLRRSSDNATSGFTEAELRDGTALAWIGANNAFVVTIYGQNGAFDLTQSTAGSQTQIASAGAWIVTQNGLPGVRFNGTGDYAAADGNYGLSDAIYTIQVVETDNTANNMHLFHHNIATGNQRSWIIYYNSGSFRTNLSRDGTNAGSSQNLATFGSFTHSTAYIREDQIDASEATAANTLKMWLNGSPVSQTAFSGTVASSTLHNSTTSIRLGGLDSGFFYLGDWFLSVAFADNKVADRADIYDWVYNKFFVTEVIPDNAGAGPVGMDSLHLDVPIIPQDAGAGPVGMDNLFLDVPILLTDAGAGPVGMDSLEIIVPLAPDDMGAGPVGMDSITITTYAPVPEIPRAPEATDPQIPYRVRIGKVQSATNIVVNPQFQPSTFGWHLNGCSHAKDPFGNGLNYIQAHSNYGLLRQYGLFIEGKSYVVKYVLRANNCENNPGYAAVRLGKYGKEVNVAPTNADSEWVGEEFTEIRICLNNDYLEIKVRIDCSITNVRAYDYLWNNAIDEVPNEIQALQYKVENDDSFYARYVSGLDVLTFQADGYDLVKAKKASDRGEGFLPVMIEYQAQGQIGYKPIFEGEIVMSRTVETYIDACDNPERVIVATVRDTGVEELIMQNKNIEVDMYGFDGIQTFGLPQIWSILNNGLAELEGYTLYDAFDYIVCYITNARAKFESVSLSTGTETWHDVLGDQLYEGGIFPVNRPSVGDFWFTTTFSQLFEQLRRRLSLRVKFIRTNGVPVVKIEFAEYDKVLTSVPYSTASNIPTVWKEIIDLRGYTEAYAKDLIKVITIQNNKVTADPINEIPNRYYVHTDMYERELSLSGDMVYDPDNDQSFNVNDLVLYLMAYQQRNAYGAPDPREVKYYEIVTPNVFATDALALKMWRYEVRNGYPIVYLDKTVEPITEVQVSEGLEHLLSEVDFTTNEFCDTDIEQIINREGFRTLNQDASFRKSDSANSIGPWLMPSSWVALNGIATGLYVGTNDNILYQLVEEVERFDGNFYFELEVEYAEIHTGGFEIVWVDATGAKISTVQDIGTTSNDYELAGTWFASGKAPSGAKGFGLRMYSTAGGVYVNLIVTKFAIRQKYDSSVLDKMIRFDGFRYGRIQELDLTLSSGLANVVLRSIDQTP